MNKAAESALLSLAQQYLKVRNVALAKKTLSMILQENPNSSKANELLAYAEGSAGNLTDAINLLVIACKQKNCSSEALYNLGKYYVDSGQPLRALDFLKKSISKNAQFLESHHYLGLAYAKINDYEKAIDLFKKAISINPASAESLNNLNNCLTAVHKDEEALPFISKACELEGGNAIYLTNKGVTLHNLKRYDEALEAYQEATQADSNYAAAWSNMGNTLSALKQTAQAINAYDRSIEIDPTYSNAYWNKSLAQLLLGNYEEGLQNYESRWLREGADTYLHSNIPKLRSLEEAITKKVLVWSEQGYGDTLQFCRYIPLLIEKGIKVVLETQAPLLPLLKDQFDCPVTQIGQAYDAVDYQIPLGSLPLLFKTRVDTIPANSPYLKVRDSKVLEWKNKLDLKQDKSNIGIACSGNIKFDLEHGNTRPIPLELLGQLSKVANLYLIQKDVRPIDRHYIDAHPEIVYLGSQIQDFEDSAAITQNMDEIITIDTSLAHLAGALGKETKVLLPWVPDWRWLLERQDNPWYPNLTLYRQEIKGDWDHALEDIYSLWK
jgi:tetratricopeptide (TPR) repeat protein